VPTAVRRARQVLAVRHANSAYHASAIDKRHTTQQLDLLLQEVEMTHKLNRREIAARLLYVSHETFTHARGGGCAGAEVTALRAAFGADLPKVLITNSKGMTGHAMGVCFEAQTAALPERARPCRLSPSPAVQDAVAVAALASGRVPPIVNHCEVDPVLGDIRLSKGGHHDAKCAPAAAVDAVLGADVPRAMTGTRCTSRRASGPRSRTCCTPRRERLAGACGQRRSLPNAFAFCSPPLESMGALGQTDFMLRYTTAKRYSGKKKKKTKVKD
jgi:hypothetical protein